MAITIDGDNGFTTDNAALKLDGTTLVVDDTNNRVGIGTASPSNPLHVLATAAGETTVKFESNQAGAMNVALDVDTDRDCLLQFQEAGTTRWDIFMNGSSGTNPLLIRDDDGTTQGSFDQSGNFKFNSGYGSAATAYGVRAWVNFNGTTNTGGNCDIRASGNVSSVTDNNTGDYTINFSTALVDDDYAVSGMGSNENSSGNRGANGFMLGNDANMLAGSCTVLFAYGSTASSDGSLMDPALATIMVVR